MWLWLLVACTKSTPQGDSPGPVDTETGTHTDTETVDELVAVPDPGPPVAPTTVDQLTFTARTGTGTFDGTDTNTLSLCLTATDCFPMDTRDVDDFRVGESDTFWFEGIGLDRSAIDRVEVRSRNGSDRWVMDCLDVRLDGEPVFCADDLGVFLGNGSNEVESFSDTLRVGCRSCIAREPVAGPMLGVTGPDTVRVWLRTDATRQVALRMAHTEAGLADGPVVAWAYPPARDAFAAVLTATGLLPATTYWYRVEVDGVPVGRARPVTTAPAAGAPVQARLAFGSCSYLDSQPIFGVIDQQEPDLFLFIGDNHYGNTADLGAHRYRYADVHTKPARAALLDHVPVLATWDDHDFVGNNTLGTAAGKDVALRAFREHWANASYGGPVDGVFSRVSYGDVDVFLLDDRYWRGIDDSVLGDAQTAWLESELLASNATFKLLASGSQFTLRGSNDSWAVWPDAQRALLAHIDTHDIGGVVLLSGDIHRSEMRLLPNGSSYPIPELTSSPLANIPSPCLGTDAETRVCHAGNSFITLDFDTTAADPTLVARLLADDGAVLHTWTILRSDLD